MSNLMKRLTIGDASYEICDASAREALERIGTGGGVSSWNDLTDKPFGEEQIVLDIHWDGELADRIYIEDASSDIKGYFVHVSDCTSKEAVVGATLGYMVIADDGTTTEGTIVLTENFCIPYGEATMIGEAHALIVPYDNFDLMGMGVLIFPKAGIYFTKREGMVTVTSLVGESTVVHKLDKKYTNNPVVVNITYTYNEETDEYTDITSDVGYNEIADAYKNGSPVFVCETGDNMFRYPAIIHGGMYNDMLGIYMDFNVIYTDYNNDNVFRIVNMAHPAFGGGVQMQTMPAVSSLPEITTENNGQILGVTDGAWSVMDAPSGLPEVSATENGKVLTVTDGIWGVMDAPSGLPEVSATENGKVLTVADGAWGVGEIDVPEVNYPVTSVNGMTGDVTVEKELPEATADNNGAFLRIVNGVPTWVMLEIAEEGAY